MKIGYKSDIGKKREVDEDSIVIVMSDAVYESKKVQAALLVLADGMGGHNAGEVAGCLAAKRVAEEMIKVMLEKNQRELSHRRISMLFQESINQANREIAEYVKKNPQYKGMGTTVTAGLVQGNNVYIGHVGDSRAYIINKRGIKQITKDHSLVQEMVDNKKITKEKARVHPQKNVITRAVGIHEDVEVDTFREYVDKGDFLLICCDGLTDMVTDEEIHTVIIQNDNPQTICDILVEKANEKGGFDNISVIVAKFDELNEKDILMEKTQIRSDMRKKGIFSKLLPQ